jgi:trehalose/maltose transport system permease protein
VDTQKRSQAATLPALQVASIAFLGAAALLLVGFVATVLNHPTLLAAQTAEGSTSGDVILAFLTTFGIVVPLVVLFVSFFLFRIGLDLQTNKGGTANWARQVLLWGVIALSLFGLYVANTSQSLVAGLPWLLGGVAALALMMWLNDSTKDMLDLETYGSRETRMAWNLLIPTLLVLGVVAIRPLEQTFVASLTDRQLASGDKVNFVGLSNYANLLNLRFDVLPCTRTEDGSACLQEPTRRNPEVLETVFPRPREAIEGYREQRFNDLITWQVGESQWIISGTNILFFEAVGNTLIFSVITVTLELTLGMFIALVVHSKFPGRGLLRTAMLVPWAIPTVVSARLWELIMAPNSSGALNGFLISIGVVSATAPIVWLNTEWGLWSIIAIDVWKTTPFMALILLAGLQVIPSDIYEAADVDGANRVTQFFSLTLPLLRPTIAVALVFRTLDAIRVFDVFQVLLSDTKLSMATYNYQVLIENKEFGYASAVGVVIFALILIFTITYVRILGVSAE